MEVDLMFYTSQKKMFTQFANWSDSNQVYVDSLQLALRRDPAISQRTFYNEVSWQSRKQNVLSVFLYKIFTCEQNFLHKHYTNITWKQRLILNTLYT